MSAVSGNLGLVYESCICFDTLPKDEIAIRIGRISINDDVNRRQKLPITQWMLAGLPKRKKSMTQKFIMAFMPQIG